MLIDEMTEEVVLLAKEGDANFLQLAKALRELCMKTRPSLTPISHASISLKSQQDWRSAWGHARRQSGPLWILAITVTDQEVAVEQ
jgi:hypothetical protein